MYGSPEYWKAGSIVEKRCVVTSLSRPPRWAAELRLTAIHTRPIPAASAVASPPAVVPTTRDVRGSTRETVRED